MNPSSNGVAFVDSLAETVGQLDAAAACGREIAPQIDRVYMVSCGAGFWIMHGLQWWADSIAKNVDFRTFTSAEFMDLNPGKVDMATTLVILLSKSGETKETLEAAKSVKVMACKTVVFTQSAQSQLAKYGDKKFFTGQTIQAFQAVFMLVQAFLGGIWEVKEQWQLLPKLLSSLAVFPATLVSAAAKHEDRGKNNAARYKQGDQIYLVASGPGKLVSGAFGLCVLEEMLKLPIRLVDADQFFHSTLEIAAKDTPHHFILILTEDASRKQMERLVDFCKQHGGPMEIYDTREYVMEGIDPDIRAMVAPYVAEGALKPYALSLSGKTGRSLSERKYMGRVAY